MCRRRHYNYQRKDYNNNECDYIGNHNVRLTLLVLGAHTLYSIPLAAAEVKSQVHYANYIDRMELFHLEQIIAWKRVVRLS